MSASAQCMWVSATVWKQWMQNVAAVVLDTVEQLIIRVFDQLGGRRRVRTAVTGSYTAAQKSFNALPVCGRSEPPAGAGGIQQPGNDNRSVDVLQCYVTQSVRPENSQGVQSPCTWTDDVLHAVGETVTPSIFNEDTRAMSGSGGGGWTAWRVLLLVNSTSTHFWRLRWRLLWWAHASTLSISDTLLWAFAAGIMTYVSSAYLQRLFPGVTEQRSAAATT